MELIKYTDGDGKFLSAVYQTEAGFVVVRANNPLNKIVRQRVLAESIAEADAMFPNVVRY